MSKKFYFVCKIHQKSDYLKGNRIVDKEITNSFSGFENGKNAINNYYSRKGKRCNNLEGISSHVISNKLIKSLQSESIIIIITKENSVFQQQSGKKGVCVLCERECA